MSCVEKITLTGIYWNQYKHLKRHSFNKHALLLNLLESSSTIISLYDIINFLYAWEIDCSRLNINMTITMYN